MKKNFKYIDLFAGIGGFHEAMSNQGGKCVFAAEIDKHAVNTYLENYGIDSENNVRDLDVAKIPNHDVLCAGFPCQSFSKAGKREGLRDTRGTLFFEIERILKYHKTKYIILENVKNLISHENGDTWKTIHDSLKKMGYRTTTKPIVVSPHHFGVPQLRERVVILGLYDPENNEKDLIIEIPSKIKKTDNDLRTILEEEPVADIYYLNEYESTVLNAWNEFYKGININVIGFPIWVDYFRGSISDEMPNWKKNFIIKNNELYKSNKKFIDFWLKKYDVYNTFTKTHRKFEWQAGTRIDNIWDGIIQFRPSGIRVKTPDCFPALVAMVQIPIIGFRKRRLTVREAARLQSFPDSFIPNDINQQAYKQFGNAVNVTVIEEMSKQLFNI